MKYEFESSPWWEYINAIDNLDAEYEIKKNIIRSKLRGAQSKCQHPTTTYYPDPSGNNDSHTECDICGKII